MKKFFAWTIGGTLAWVALWCHAYPEPHLYQAVLMALALEAWVMVPFFCVWRSK